MVFREAVEGCNKASASLAPDTNVRVSTDCSEAANMMSIVPITSISNFMYSTSLSTVSFSFLSNSAVDDD